MLGFVGFGGFDFLGQNENSAQHTLKSLNLPVPAGTQAGGILPAIFLFILEIHSMITIQENHLRNAKRKFIKTNNDGFFAHL